MSFAIRVVNIAIALIFASNAAVMAANKAVVLGQYGDWAAVATESGGNKICYAATTPKTSTASRKNVRRDPIYFFVTNWPHKKVYNDVSVVMGYPLKKTNVKEEQPLLTIDGEKKFEFMASGENVWLKNIAYQQALIEAMRDGGKMVMVAKSTRGTVTTDTYSLVGISKALDKIRQECK